VEHTHLKTEKQPSLRNALCYIYGKTMDNAQNCDSYINTQWSQTYRSLFCGINRPVIWSSHWRMFNNSIQFNSIQFFIIYVPSQQPQGQLQTQHSNRYT
jgi:hypothetical protein